MDFPAAAVNCGLGEKGLSGSLLTDDFGPFQRYAFVLTDAEIEDILGKLDDLTRWASEISAYAQDAAVNHGKHWKGFKLVESRTTRKYINENAVIAAVSEAGYDPYEKKVHGITAMQKILGKKQFDALLGHLIEKPQGKPTLVPVSDKRPAITVTGAKQDFSEFMEE